MNRKQRRARTHGTMASPFPAGALPNPTLLFQEACRFFQAGQLNDAARLFRRVLALDPRHAEALHLSGLIAFSRGRADTALDLIGKAIAIDGAVVAYHTNQGTILGSCKRFDEAVAAFGTAARLDPRNAVIHSNLGSVLRDLGRLDAAADSCRTAIRLKPDYAKAHANLGNILRDQRKFEDAVAAYGTALRLDPGLHEVLSSLGETQINLGRLDEAVDSCRAAIRLKPDFAAAYSNLGVVLTRLGQLDEGMVACETAVRLKPDSAQAYSNLGSALVALNRVDEGIASFRTAIRLDPDYSEAHANLSILHLLKGDFPEGWEEYEWRRRCFGRGRTEIRFSEPEWRGEALDGRTLLIWLEQGMGDVLQFCRYARAIKGRGGRIVLHVHPPLARLLSAQPDFDQVVAIGDALPPFDCQIPLMSLPRVMGTTLETIPAEIPYLAADRDLVARMSKSLDVSGRKIGFVWRGNPHHDNDRNRSIGLERLEPLFAVEGVTFVSLQKDPTTGEKALLERHANVVDANELIGDFADTAALVADLDLVVSVDTSVVHLAGALGRPVWILLPLVPDWRWLLDRDDSPWYPTARLFRQTERGDWEAVIQQVTDSLSLGG